MMIGMSDWCRKFLLCLDGGWQAYTVDSDQSCRCVFVHGKSEEIVEHGYRKNVKEHGIRVVKLGRKVQYSDTLNFLSGVVRLCRCNISVFRLKKATRPCLLIFQREREGLTLKFVGRDDRLTIQRVRVTL